MYLAALVGAGALVARSFSTGAAAVLVVAGILVLAVIAFRSRNRSADAGMDGVGYYAAGGGDWDVGGDGGGGGGD